MKSHSIILDTNSKKRLAYCSGLTVEISATACMEYRENIYTYVHCAHGNVIQNRGTFFINPRRACAARVTVVGFVCLCVCLSVKSHLTSGASVRLENTVMYSAGNKGQ